MRTGMKRTMVVAWAITLLMSMAVPLSAGAQDRRGPRRMGGFGGPTWWVSAWGGYQWSDQVGDPGTKSTWDFDSNWSVRFTAEREVAPRTTIGAVVGVQPFGGHGLSGTGPKAGGPYYLQRFASEKVVSTNTAAAGGNASLVMLEE